MASPFTRTRPNETRTPEFTELPDGRKRLTRYFDLADGDKVSDALVDAYGTLDAGDTATPCAGFADLRLVEQRLERDPARREGNRSVYVKVYEELPATAEVQVGGATTGNTLIALEDGRSAVVAEFLQLAAGTYVPGTVGTTTAPGDTSAFLQKAEMTHDGALRRIKRTYVYAGQLSQTDETKNNGKLLLRTLVYVKTVPGTPAGYTLIREQSDPVNGIPVYTYTFAKGTGEYSREFTCNGNPNTNFDPTGPVSSSDGVKICTVLTLTASSVTTDPTIGPPSGYFRFAVDYVDRDGHRAWSVKYAAGTGTIINDSQTKNGGLLVIYHKVALGTSAPTAPSATIGGTVTLVDAKIRSESGYKVFDYTWAEGQGEIGRDIDYGQSADQGTSGVTRTTIRYLVAGAATVQPTSLAGSVEIGRNVVEQDGYRIWTTVWAKGTGTVTTDVETKNGGKLVIYHRVALGAVPSTPSATIAGTVTLIADDSRAADGFTLYDRTWAEGVGIIGERTQTREGGLLLLNRDILLAPGGTDISAYTPAAGILITKEYADLDGYRRWSATWMQKSDGTSPTTGTAVATEAYIPFTYPGRAKHFSVAFTTGGYTSHAAKDVFLAPPVQCLVLATSTITYQTGTTVGALANTLWNPTEWTTLRARWIAWANAPQSKVEGLRGYTIAEFTVTGTASDNVISQTAHGYADGDQVEFTVLNGGSGLAINTTYFVRDKTANTFKVAATAGGAAVGLVTDITSGSKIRRLVMAGSSGGTGLDTSVLGSRVYASTDWQIGLSGGPRDPGGGTWTLAAAVDPTPAFTGYDGTKYYRLTVVTAAIAAQTALPV